ncbi:MAG: hypothetical protein HY271_09795 [Deltaproteobacteria bacterium]|nr:hypothetical protein [Deltaproteobacteria bacterium]
MDIREVYIAHTHREWFDFLSRNASGGRIDEVNFWFPKRQEPPKRFQTGEPVFFRLGAPERRLVGYGFFASFQLLPLDLVWDSFGYRSGAPDESTLYRLLGRVTDAQRRIPVACTLLLDAHFWPAARWIDWGTSQNYADSGIQGGRTERDPASVDRLLTELQRDAAQTPAELLDEFEPLTIDERDSHVVAQPVREGQGAFRLRLLDAYGACAITGEHTEPVLDAGPHPTLLRPQEQSPTRRHHHDEGIPRAVRQGVGNDRTTTRRQLCLSRSRLTDDSRTLEERTPVQRLRQPTPGVASQRPATTSEPRGS